MHCSTCSNHDLVAIHLTISARPVALYRCPRCDTRTWADAAGRISRDGVLELVRSSR